MLKNENTETAVGAAAYKQAQITSSSALARWVHVLTLLKECELGLRHARVAGSAVLLQGRLLLLVLCSGGGAGDGAGVPPVDSRHSARRGSGNGMQCSSQSIRYVYY